jgi:hypothetical protein
MEWIHRQVANVREKVEAKMKEKASEELRNEFVTLTNLVIGAKDHLIKGDAQRLNILRYREELEDSIPLIEEKEAVIEARKRLDTLPLEEEYRITFDRDTAKFVIKLLDKEINWIQQTNLPNLEKRKSEDFTDSVMTKSYYINKTKKAKSILEEMRKDLEKGLV